MDILTNILSGLVGVLLAVLFDEPLRSIKLRSVGQAKSFFRSKKPIPIPENFSIGSIKTSFLIIDGDGDMEYTPKTLICRTENKEVELPSEILELRDRIEKREKEKEANGLPRQWNGPLLALDRYAIERTVPYEYLEVILTFRHTDYFTFQATVLSLDTNLARGSGAVLTLRQKYLNGHNYSEPITFLANGIGIVLVIITKDKKVIFSHRNTTVGARAGEIDVSVVEGIHPLHDRAIDHSGPDLFRTAIRGAQEEVGIELLQSDITFLGFGVDIEYYQWNIIGLAHISKTAQQAVEDRNRGTGGKWETRKFEMIDFNPKTVFNYLKSHKMWSPGWVAIYWALVHEWGKKKVNVAVKEIIV